MKNKIVTIGTLCLVLVLGLVFVGCDDFQKVEYGSVGKPGNVTAVISKSEGGTAGDIILVTWDAVSGADGYTVVYSQSGKKTYSQAAYGGPIENDTGTIPDIDKWAAVISYYSLADNEGTSFTVGVIASSAKRDKNDSSPAWASGTFKVGATKFE